MAVLRVQKNVKNKDGGYDVIHYETEAGLTTTSDGKTVEAALSEKANTGHTHDDRYYTEAEVDSKLAAKGPGDMLAATYDPNKKKADIYKYADDKAAAAEAAAKLASRPATWTPTAGDVGADPAGSAAAVDTKLTAHTGNKSNPHGVTAAQAGAVPTGRKVNGKPLSADVTLAAEDVGAVPTARKVNGKPLSADISLTAGDVGADPAGSAAAVKSKSISASLTVAGWTVTAAPYTQSLSIAEIKDANTNGDIGLAQNATTAQREAARNAMLSVTGQAAGSLTITADGDKPTIDLPVTVTILG